MLTIRLFRTGKKNQPFFKIVVTDKRNPPRAGRFVEEVGSLDPIKKKHIIKKDRVEHWISKGAKPSDTVHNLLVTEGIVKGQKVPLHKKSKSLDKKEPASKIGDSSNSGKVEATRIT